MSEAFFKSELIKRIRSGYEQFADLIGSLSEEQLTTPGVNGSWSVKDNLAHLTVWQNYMQERLRAAHAGSEPPTPFSQFSSEDEINEYVYQQNKDRPLADVLADFTTSYQSLLALVEATPEEVLTSPFPWNKGGNPSWEFVAGNTYGHYEEHGNIIRRWLA